MILPSVVLPVLKVTLARDHMWSTLIRLQGQTSSASPIISNTNSSQNVGPHVMYKGICHVKSLHSSSMHWPAARVPLSLPPAVPTSTVIVYSVVGSRLSITTLESVVLTVLTERTTVPSCEEGWYVTKYTGNPLAWWRVSGVQLTRTALLLLTLSTCTLLTWAVGAGQMGWYRKVIKETATLESHKEHNTGPWFHNTLAFGYFNQYYSVIVYCSVVHALHDWYHKSCMLSLILHVTFKHASVCASWSWTVSNINICIPFVFQLGCKLHIFMYYCMDLPFHGTELDLIVIADWQPSVTVYIVPQSLGYSCESARQMTPIFKKEMTSSCTVWLPLVRVNWFGNSESPLRKLTVLMAVIWSICTLLHCKDNYWHWFSFSNRCPSSDSDVVGNSRLCGREGELANETKECTGKVQIDIPNITIRRLYQVKSKTQSVKHCKYRVKWWTAT